jgi:hypothetical protein
MTGKSSEAATIQYGFQRARITIASAMKPRPSVRPLTNPPELENRATPPIDVNTQPAMTAA